MKKFRLYQLLLVAIFSQTPFTSIANVRLNSLFSDNAVFQREVTVPVWGTAADGEKITVSFAGQEQTTNAKDGKWLIKLKPLKAGGPFTMTVTASNVLTVKNILVGEVWLCSGQSNMAFPLRAIAPRDGYPVVDSVLADAANFPMIREFNVPLRKSTAVPPIVDDVNGSWNVCNSTTAKNFSAVGYFFGRELYKQLKVPIGLVKSAYGGTAAENWISKEEMDAIPELNSILTNYEKALHEFPEKLASYQKNEPELIAKFKADSAVAQSQNKELPRKPSPPMHPAERGGPSGLYNSMIYPLMPYAIKGVVWYQGEANGGRGQQYRTLLPLLIRNWRNEWKEGDFPFLIVQIPGWKAHTPELREAQLLTSQKVSNTAMTVILDCDDTLDVHPKNKQPVGERLVLAARAIAYKEKIEYAGPIFESMKVKDHKIILNFTHTGSGLIVKGDVLKDFTVAGVNKQFVPATAEVHGNQVIVYSTEVPDPAAVRYGWRLCPQGNLYNKGGLQAAPFRTDLP